MSAFSFGRDEINKLAESGLRDIPKSIICSAWRFHWAAQHENIPEDYLQILGADKPRGIIELLWNPETRNYFYDNYFPDLISYNKAIKSTALVLQELEELMETLMYDEEFKEQNIFDIAYSRLIEKLD